MSKKAIICDIDNTLALRGDRDIYNFKKAGLDKLNRPVAKIIELFKKDGYAIILISGREDKFRDETLKWLEENHIKYGKIFFRKEGDYRKDEVIKKEIYKKFIKKDFDVLFVLDDRNRVVDMWRKKLNLVCLQVDYGDF